MLRDDDGGCFLYEYGKVGLEGKGREGRGDGVIFCVELWMDRRVGRWEHSCHLVCMYVQAKARSRDQWEFSVIERASGWDFRALWGGYVSDLIWFVGACCWFVKEGRAALL